MMKLLILVGVLLIESVLHQYGINVFHNLFISRVVIITFYQLIIIYIFIALAKRKNIIGGIKRICPSCNENELVVSVFTKLNTCKSCKGHFPLKKTILIPELGVMFVIGSSLHYVVVGLNIPYLTPYVILFALMVLYLLKRIWPLNLKS
jgi:uncharacterized protein (DUF983 family)